MTCILLPVLAPAQDINAHSPTHEVSTRQQKIAEKKKLEQQQQLAKAIEKGKKQHEKIQAKNARKMMRKSKRTSKHWNENRK